MQRQATIDLRRTRYSRSFRGRAVTGALAAVLAGTLAFAPTLPSAIAQQRAEQPTIQTPFGRAPLTFADIVERVKPAVVSVHVTNGNPRVSSRSGRPAPEGRSIPGLPNLPDDHPLNDFFKNLPREFGGQQGPQQQPRPSLAQGSGFVISEDGFIVTNNHVIDGASKITVSFDQQHKYEAELIGTDSRTDVALLKIKEKRTFPFVKFASKPARVGDWVIAVGNPFGLGGTVTAGIVSANARDIGSGPYDFLQIDAAVNRGNSGGPTFNLDGEVIGVNTAIYSPSGGNVGIAFAVPARTASEVVQQLRSKGSVQRGWLGVRIESIDADKASSLGLSEAQGALVNDVTSGGPAAASGLRAGDAIMSVDGTKIRDSRELARKIAEYAPGTTVKVEVVRYGKRETIPVKLGLFPSGRELANIDQPKNTAPTVTPTELEQLGMSLMPATSQANGASEGVEIKEVKAGSDASTKGLKSGDIILEVQGEKVKSPSDVEAGVKKAKDIGRKAVLLRIKSGDALRFVAVQLKAG